MLIKEERKTYDKVKILHVSDEISNLLKLLNKMIKAIFFKGSFIFNNTISFRFP